MPRTAARLPRRSDLFLPIIFGGLIGVAMLPGCSPGQPRGESGAAEVVAMNRVADQTCEDPGGWSNLFFESDSIRPGTAVALFAELEPDHRIEVVRHETDGGSHVYGLRSSQEALELPLELTAVEDGRCATMEVPLPPTGSGVRIQVAVTGDYTYGRVAEHREGTMSTERGPVHIEVRPQTRAPVRFDRVSDLALFVDSDRDGAIRPRTALDSAGNIEFGEEAGEAFVLDGKRFRVDSLSANGTRLYLGRPGDVAPFRGFRAPVFAGTDVDGGTHQLTDYAGHFVVVEFWSTECPFSEQARPTARRLAAALEAHGGVYLSMARESDLQAIRAHLKEHPLGGTVLAREGATWDRWNPQTATPLYYVIAPDGTIVLREMGASAVALAASAAGINPTGLLDDSSR